MRLETRDLAISGMTCARIGGRRVIIGNRALARKNCVRIDGGESRAARLEAQGRTVMWIAALDRSRHGGA